jgi:Tfp pilus assembly protein PilO
MNSRTTLAALRAVVPVAAIGAAALYAVHGLLLEPDAQRLTEARSKLDHVRASAAQSHSLELAKSNLHAQRAELKRQISDVQRRSSPALDQRDLFEQITRIAHDTSVEIDHLKSVDWKPRVSATAEASVLVVAGACSMNLVGMYDDLRRFVGTLETQLGFASVTKVRLAPYNDSGLVLAEIDLTCYAIDAAASSAALLHVHDPLENKQ